MICASDTSEDANLTKSRRDRADKTKPSQIYPHSTSDQTYCNASQNNALSRQVCQRHLQLEERLLILGI